MATAAKCPNCNAHLPVVVDADSIRCEYCGKEVAVERKRPAASPARTAAPPPRPQLKPLQVIVPILLVMSIGSVMAYFSIRAKTQHQPAAAAATTTATPVRVRWNETQPRLVDLDGDGVEDLITVIWRYENSDNFVYLQAVSGQSWQPLWRVGAFGSVTESAQLHTRFVAGDNHLAVADFRSILHIFTLADGQPTRELSLSDRMERGCVDPASGDQVWLELADQQHLSVDLATGDSSPAARPDWCPELRRSSICYQDYNRYHGVAECLDPSRVVDPEGFKGETILEQAGQLVALGYKHPGTRVPMVAGFVAAAGEKPAARPSRRRKPNPPAVAWVRNLGDGLSGVTEGTPALADLVAGKLYVQYPTTTEVRFARLDATTGETDWEVVLPNPAGYLAMNIAFTADRLFLPTYGSIVVLERDSGKLIHHLQEG